MADLRSASAEECQVLFRRRTFHELRETEKMRNSRLIALVASATIACTSFGALACTRFIYETGANSYIVGRSMDWAVDPATDLWCFPKGLKRDGGAGPGSVEWTSKPRRGFLCFS